MRIFPSRSAISILIVGLLCFKRSGNQEIHHSDVETGWQFVSPALPTNCSNKKHIINSFVFKSWKFVDHPTIFSTSFTPQESPALFAPPGGCRGHLSGAPKHLRLRVRLCGDVLLRIHGADPGAGALGPPWRAEEGPHAIRGPPWGVMGGPWISVFFFSDLRCTCVFWK